MLSGNSWIWTQRQTWRKRWYYPTWL